MEQQRESTKMRAVVRHEYGPPDVLRLEEIDKPVPDDGEILVKVHAAALNPVDWHILRADPFFLRLAGFGLVKPKRKVLGADMAGRVEEVGKNVTDVRVGDEVFGDVISSGQGSYAEYVCVPAKLVIPKPVNTSFEEAAAVPLAGVTALQTVRDHAKVESGQHVLVNGASGGVGTYAVQIAKAYGAEVTGVCSTRNLELIRSIGADHVIDYTEEDFTHGGERFDAIVDAAAFRPASRAVRALKPNGRYVMVGGSNRSWLQLLLTGPWNSMVGGKKMGSMLAKANRQDLVLLKELVETSRVRPVIDRTYPLREVPDALRYLEEGHARGKIVISI